MKLLKGKPLADEILEAVKTRVEALPNAPVLKVYCDDREQPYYRGILKDAVYCGIHVIDGDNHYIRRDGAISLIDSYEVPDDLNMDGGDTTPCTAEATMRLLAYYDIPVHGRDVCIIGRSERVGKPLARLMTEADATVTLCHSKTPRESLETHLYHSDIVVSCVGNAGFEFWHPKLENGKKKVLIDIGGDFSNAGIKCTHYAPAVGGVGPVTRAVLMKHVLERCIQNYHG